MIKKPIRYAVVGLGHIAQVAVLPAFKNCKSSSLVAMFSGDSKKRRILGRKYRIDEVYSYDDFDRCLESGGVDAVYLALPNHLHKEFTIRAARLGVHVLCEKPMAVTSEECVEMTAACTENGVKLMIAYRLHFEAANLQAIDLVNRKKRIGAPKIFQSIHSQMTQARNIRTESIQLGGGPSYDIGVYDINAARYLFHAEPVSVFAEAVSSGKGAFRSIEETMSVVMKFPGDRLAAMTYSFGAADMDLYRVVGTLGDLSLDPAYGYVGKKTLRYSSRGKEHRIQVPAHDHFAAEIDYFSSCILKNKVPEPSGREGLADVRIIEAIFKSARTGAVVRIPSITKTLRPEPGQEIDRPPMKEPEIVDARPPTRKIAA